MPKFVKGQSGNPSGRPKSKELREICRQYTTAAVETLARIMAKSKSDMARIYAARELLDRGFGKPMQAVEVAVEDARVLNTNEREQLTQPEVVNLVGKLLAEAEKEMGIDPNTGLTEKERLNRLLESGTPIPPDLYKAWQLYRGQSETAH